MRYAERRTKAGKLTANYLKGALLLTMMVDVDDEESKVFCSERC